MSKPYFSFSIAIGMLIAAPIYSAPQSSTAKLISRINKKCNLRPGVLTAIGEAVHLAPLPTDKYEQIDCALAGLKKANVTKMGFVGNEIDEKAILPQPYRYIAEGSEAQIARLTEAVQTEGWIVVEYAKTDEGRRFLWFKTHDGETVGGAEKLMKRIWANEFGDIAFGMAPRKISERSDED